MVKQLKYPGWTVFFLSFSNLIVEGGAKNTESVFLGNKNTESVLSETKILSQYFWETKTPSQYFWKQKY